MNGQTDKRTDGRSDFIMPQILFGGIKIGTVAENRIYQSDFYSWLAISYLLSVKTITKFQIVYINPLALHSHVLSHDLSFAHA